MSRASVWVALGGALGTLARNAIALWAEPISHALPWGTMAINVIGSLVIGFFGTLTLGNGRFPAPESMRLFVMVGICGGFTTFSSFSLQTFDLLLKAQPMLAVAHVAISIAVGMGAIAIGHGAASYLNRGAAGIAENAIEEEAS